MGKINIYAALITALIISALLPGCEKEDDGRDKELLKIRQYLIDKGYQNIEPTSSGLYHIVLSEGDGPTPGLTDFLNINFTGTLIDGRVFETSSRSVAESHGILQEGKLYGPTRFFLERLGIAGLKEGLMLMQEGGRSRLIIPSDLAFGAMDYGIISPYSTLVYDIDLLDVIADPEEHEHELLLAFLDENDIDVSPTESGLYYIEQEEGSGDLPGDGDWVTIHFSGSLLDGRVFNNTRTGNNEPAEFNLATTQLIPAFIEGIKMMKQNGKARFILPWDIAYGEGGSNDGAIPPYSTIIFDVELVNIR